MLYVKMHINILNRISGELLLKRVLIDFLVVNILSYLIDYQVGNTFLVGNMFT